MLVERAREVLRLRHSSPRTAEVYVGWMRRFIQSHRRRHPREMGEAEVATFLTHLAVAARVSASTQNQALSALLFLYRHVLGRPLGDVGAALRARRSDPLPVVLSRDVVRALLARLDGVARLVAGLLYGAGLRLHECLELRVKDLDLDRRQIMVRQGKGTRTEVCRCRPP